ncbi:MULTISPECIES: cytochrome P450 [Streptomyces]|uniref:Cytochrome P450 n=1 Tax=Streptomyces venezuelae TaxID=54571 RepID=A0A5P2BDG3_STRVZ|nr:MULTISPECIES: cytochrome P450 [Streptomyces]NEA04228.1 cytochrome P450 [Streptomyces sp. SID10116]MYY86724.1 cytochrome P450 [Streptomyces sp. SID335]MYZ19300.1 cytochrome P450 [Streptomyces sp. SID337]NDZ90072.1 cytochrome P450 [Streptomyces sp. SID10115]NEB44501.1 cytochrome P450 [Streptomyces sp. SID339]
MPIPGPVLRADGGVGAISDAGGLHLYQRRLHAEYGGVVRFQLPGVGVAVSVADPLVLEQTVRIDERPSALFAFLEPLCEAGNLQVIGAEEHAPWRRVLLEALAGRPSHERHFGEFVSLVEGLAERWAGAGGDAVLLQKDLTALSLRMICAYALGGAGSDVVRAEEVVDAFEVVLSEADPTTQRASLALDHLRATVDRVIAAHEGGREIAPEDDRSDLIRALMAARTSPARIRDTVMVTMLAAHHTTGVAVSWTLHLLGRHPEVAERVAAELDRVLGDRSAPDYGDLRELTYLDMVLKESMRLYPPGPYGARETTEDMVLSGADGTYGIPAGTTVFYPFWAVHMNPDHWPEPEEFRPERFTPEAVAARSRFAYVPFGLGPRSCEGAGLAMVEAQLTLAVLLKRFRFRPVEGHEVTPVERFVLWAADDIPMVVTPRATAGR